jgi:cytochrome bd-type quinol oxidase subunit 2
VILFYGVLNGLIWLPMASVTRERTEQTLAFIISLPVTIREYTAAKIISQVLVFLIPWLVLGTSALVLIVTNESVSNDYIPLTLVVLTQLFTLFCLILAVALVSESPGFTQTVGVIANVVFWFSFSFIGVAPGFGVEKDPAAAWNSTLSYMLTGQLVLIPVLLILTFWLQSRKKDFLC